LPAGKIIDIELHEEKHNEEQSCSIFRDPYSEPGNEFIDFAARGRESRAGCRSARG
jgi:hypothetical protein